MDLKEKLRRRREKKKLRRDKRKSGGASTMEKARAKLKRMEEGGGGGGADFMKLKDGKQVVRIDGPWADDVEDFSMEVTEHWAKDRKSNIICPKKHAGKDCAVHEKYDEAMDKLRSFKSKHPDDPRGADRIFETKVRPYSAKTVDYVNAVFIEDGQAVGNDGEPTDKWLKLAVGPMILKQILELYTEDEADICGEFWGEDGYDFIIKKTGKGLKTKYTVKPTRKYVGEVDTSELKVNDLSAMVSEDRIPSYKQTKVIAEGGSLKRDESSDEGSDESSDEGSDDFGEDEGSEE